MWCIQDAKSTGGCLLSSKAAQELGLVTFNLNKITEQKSQTQKIKDKNVQDLISKYPLAFKLTGVIKLKDQTVKLNIDEKVILVGQPRRRIPFHIRDKVKDAIEKLEVEYRAGDENHANYMSCHPMNESISTHSKISEEYVNFVTKHAVQGAIKLKEIIEATNADKALKGL